MKSLFTITLICLALAACGNKAPTISESTSSTSTPSTSVLHTSYQVAPDEPLPNAKKLAAEVAQAVTTYAKSNDPKREVVANLGALGVASTLADNIQPLLKENVTSRSEVVYPQLGGFRNGKSSMMVATRQSIENKDGENESVVRVLDIRMQMEGQTWKAASIDSVGGEELDRPKGLTEAQEKLLDNPAIELTDTAKWDVYRNSVDARLIDSLNAMAERHRFSVIVFSQGHPLNVFESDKQSNHTKGRAADVWKVDGQLVVSQRNDGLRDLQQGLLDAGITELGGPFDLDGPTSARSFTDIVHQDHLHIAFQN